jgi:hypothetical protein
VTALDPWWSKCRRCGMLLASGEAEFIRYQEEPPDGKFGICEVAAPLCKPCFTRFRSFLVGGLFL